jgi:hypothetical protein
MVSVEQSQRSARERRFRCLLSVCLSISEIIAQKSQYRVVAWRPPPRSPVHLRRLRHCLRHCLRTISRKIPSKIRVNTLG